MRCCDPKEVILFGSYAKGKSHIDSDIDILVIGSFKEPKYLISRELKELLSQFSIKIDILLATPDDITSSNLERFSFFQSLQMHSISLYKNSVS